MGHKHFAASLPWRGKPDPKRKAKDKVAIYIWTIFTAKHGHNIYLSYVLYSQSIYLISDLHVRTIILALTLSDLLDIRI